MGISGWRLNLQQINEARRLRFELDWSWRALSRHFKCDDETVRRYIDPEFELHKRAKYEARKQMRHSARETAATIAERREKLKAAYLEAEKKAEAGDETLASRRQNIRADTAFREAMRHAIRRREENAPIGTQKQSSTDSPRFTPSRGISSFSSTSSPAGMCADIA